MLRVELIDQGSQVVERTHDLAVLSVGMLPGFDPQGVFQVAVGEDGFVGLPESNIYPSRTDRPGIFTAGTSAGPMDIVDSIVLSGAAASEAAAYLESRKKAAPEPVESEKIYA